MLYRKFQPFLNILLGSATFAACFFQGQLSAHCQMPCGIYHDDIVYDLIDQYVETMYKGISVLNNSKFSNPSERNAFVRWVMEKDKASDQAAKLISEYFLQQKIKPGESDTTKRLISAHKLLFMLVTIKQNADLDFVKTFTTEWDQFKLMFHREGYECEIDKLKLKARTEKKAAEEKAEAIAHSDDHDHASSDHTHADHTH